jgi:hypothetical protein
MKYLQINYFHVRFKIFIAVTMKNAVFWYVAACSSCLNRRFGGTYRLHLQGGKIRERGTSVSRWLQSVGIRSRSFLHPWGVAECLMTLYDIIYTLVYCTQDTLRTNYLCIQTHKHT